MINSSHLCSYFIAERKFDEDDDYLAILQETKYNRRDETDEILDSRIDVNFAMKLSTIEENIQVMAKSLETFEREDAKWMEKQIEWTKVNLSLLRPLLQNAPTADEKQLHDWYPRDIFQIPIHHRWMMYSAWRRQALSIQEQRAAEIDKLFRENTAKLKDVRDIQSAELCHNADVVGFTTTGAAKNRALLNHLKPKIG